MKEEEKKPKELDKKMPDTIQIGQIILSSTKYNANELLNWVPQILTDPTISKYLGQVSLVPSKKRPLIVQ